MTISSSLNLANQTAGETVTIRAGDDLKINASVSTGGATLTFKASETGGGFDDVAPGKPGDQRGRRQRFDRQHHLQRHDGGTGAIKLEARSSARGNDRFRYSGDLTAYSALTGANVNFDSTVNGFVLTGRSTRVLTDAYRRRRWNDSADQSDDRCPGHGEVQRR